MIVQFLDQKLWSAGFRIRSDIERIRIRIQPFRANRIRVHDFLKTGSHNYLDIVNNVKNLFYQNQTRILH